MAEPDTPHRQIWFMPWAGLTAELQIGPVVFSPFNKLAEEKTIDPKLFEHLQRYFECYVDHRGRPVVTVTICSNGSNDFWPLDEPVRRDVRAAVDSLIFSVICSATRRAVCANNNSMGPPSAERYQLLAQNFRAGEDHIAVGAGSTLSGGWRIGEITFPEPWSMGGAFGSPDDRLVLGLSKVFDPAFPSDVQERLFRGLEWFRLAHTDSDDVSPLSKVVMLATAFEIILQVPNIPKKKRWIAEKLETICANAESVTETRSDEKGRDTTRTNLAWWAWDFYNLRNSIVHGDAVEPERLTYKASERDWLTHLIVANLVLWECVTRELFGHKCIGNDVRAAATDLDKLLPGDNSEMSEPFVAAWFLGFNDVHRALGWQPEDRR